MIILAIDPGYDRCGWAVGEKSNNSLRLIDYGCIQTSKEDSFYDRYAQIIKRITQIIEKHQPTVGVLELLFFSKNQKTALRVSEIRGAIITLYIQHTMTLKEFTPVQIKLAAAGHGQADKKSVEKMVRLQLKLGSAKLIDDTILQF